MWNIAFYDFFVKNKRTMSSDFAKTLSSNIWFKRCFYVSAALRNKRCSFLEDIFKSVQAVILHFNATAEFFFSSPPSWLCLCLPPLKEAAVISVRTDYKRNSQQLRVTILMRAPHDSEVFWAFGAQLSARGGVRVAPGGVGIRKESIRSY